MRKLSRAACLRLLAEALQAPTHAVNDYNCEDWPPGDGCQGCKGDEQRAAALATLRVWLALLEVKP